MEELVPSVPGGHGVDGSSVVEERAESGSAPAGRTSRHVAVIGASIAAVVVLVAVIAVVVTRSDGSPAGPRATGTPPVESREPAVAREWVSGVGQSGDSIDPEAFGDWRGAPVELISMWEDDNVAMVELAGLRPGGAFDSWDGSMDIAIGALGDGESWGEAADGAYDDRWQESLTNLAELRDSASGVTYIRFAHEMNGDWYPWAVNEGNYEAFIDSWRRFRDLQQEIFPAAQLVFGVNKQSFDNGMDWRETFPGAEYVDVVGVDYYNQPCVATWEEWENGVDATDGHGGPLGLESHRAFAESVGLPLAVPEWAGNADQCDSPVYIEAMHAFFALHGGSGPGEVLYEAYFNVDIDGQRWTILGGDRLPESAEVYRRLF
jgi:hypothetical protein